MEQVNWLLCDLIRECLADRDTGPWPELVKRLQRHFARTVIRITAEWGVEQQRGEIEDMVQEVFLKLLENDGALLRVPITSEESAVAYLVVMAANSTHDYLKRRYAQKRGVDRTNRIEARMEELAVSTYGEAQLERAVLLTQVERALKVLGTDKKEVTIFWLYYRQGYSAKEIAALPGCWLGNKGVESLVYRLVDNVAKTLRRDLESPGMSEGKSAAESS